MVKQELPSPPAQETLWQEVRGVRLHARSWGSDHGVDEPPIVLVHGLGISSVYMVPTAEILARQWRVFAPDLPGFGQSEAPDDPMDVPTMADWLAAWMDASGIPCAHLVANSLGCQVILELARQRPANVASLVLVGPGPEPDRRTLWEQAGRLAIDAFRESPRLHVLHLLDDVRAGPRRLLEASRAALEDRPEEKLPHILAPTLVVRGADDPLVSQEWIEEMARRMPDARWVTVPDAPHAPNFSAPEALVEHILPFLERATRNHDS